MTLLNDPSNYKVSESGLLVPKNYKTYPIGLDLFAGCGGFSLGLIRAGFKIVAGVEWDLDAAWTYMVNLGSYPMQIHFGNDKMKNDFENKLQKSIESKKKQALKEIEKQGYAELYSHGELIRITDPNNPILELPDTTGSGWRHSEYLQGKFYPGVDHFFICDIRELTGDFINKTIGLSVGDLDIIVGGPPCQGFSKANHNRSKTDSRNDLTLEFVRMVVELQPKTMVMENVPDLVNMTYADGIPVIDAISSILEKGDFGTYDAMKKSLLASSGTGIIMKNSRMGLKKEETNKHEKTSKYEEAEMF